MHNRLLLLLIFLSLKVFSQTDGFWDKERATYKEIKVSAGQRIVIKTEDLPIGTTEIVYRITLLDENQQLANSLASVLKAIPDPTGISQGSAGAVFILSKVSGDDKCTYAMFASNESAQNYKETGKTEKACLTQNEAVSKDAKRISVEKSTCFNSDSNAIWFGFESKNWILKQKIILEVVPWVDYKLNRGWNIENRKSIIALAKTSDLAKKMINSDDFCLCILEKMQKQFRFQEYQKLLAIEKTKAFRDFGNACLTERPTNKTILEGIRSDANQYFKKEKYKEAIDLLVNAIVDNGNANYLDYNALGTYYLYSNQYQKAIQTLQAAEKLDGAELLIKLNLAHAYLLNGDFHEAKMLHKKFKSQNVTANQNWNTKTKSDFEDFKKNGIESEDFDRILKLID
jgi:tetratricopeptide (TPR) repeat protein